MPSGFLPFSLHRHGTATQLFDQVKKTSVPVKKGRGGRDRNQGRQLLTLVSAPARGRANRLTPDGLPCSALWRRRRLWCERGARIWRQNRYMVGGDFAAELPMKVKLCFRNSLTNT